MLDQHDMTDIIHEKCQLQQDYEWYSEDFLGRPLDDETSIKIADVLEASRPEMLRILGIGGAQK